MKKLILSMLVFVCTSLLVAAGNNLKGMVSETDGTGYFAVVSEQNSAEMVINASDYPGVIGAFNNLQGDILKVTGKKVNMHTDKVPQAKFVIIAGTIGKSSLIDGLISKKKIDGSQLKGKWEKFIIQTIDNPMPGVEKALVIAGSNKRGTIYGIYELSEQMGVSPWYWWADVPVKTKQQVYVKPGTFTDGEPAVKYRGIFINDEAPCLTTWVKTTYGTNFGDHRFYAQVFELILRLKGNYLWPAMWSWAFYADDPLNSKVADDMGVVIGTSHHEPMARNHQEYTRRRSTIGKWDYSTNAANLNKFFAEGIERIQGKDDVVTIGMRGDGDEAMSENADVSLLENIVKEQRKIIEKVSKKPAKETPQIWALYKEVLEYYEKGMRVPDDVIMLLCDDNWGNVRRLPNEQERKHPGGWGLYYHVDYVGAPRNTKWLNVTPIQHMWEQLHLTYEYGVDKLWVVNVGDIKPMEYPITLFMDMAWNPNEYEANNILDHARKYCVTQFGEKNADEAARLLNLYSKYAGRVTPEMLDAKTYNIETGEWKQVSDEFLKLEAEALRQYLTLEPNYKDAYKQLILFPIQALANLYEMYYSQAMNHKLYAENDPKANWWADQVVRTFKRDSVLGYDYNNVMSNGKWKNMMIQKKIGYTIWNDNFRQDILPKTFRIENSDKAVGKYVITPETNYASIEAPHYYELKDAVDAKWTLIPMVGRTEGGMVVMPQIKSPQGATISYKIKIPKDVKSVTVRVIVKSTLAFLNVAGHRYGVGFNGGEEKTINFNSDLNESPENRYSIFYPTVARRIVEKKVELKVPESTDGFQMLTIKPIEPGTVFEKIIVDFGGYKESYLFGEPSKKYREKE